MSHLRWHTARSITAWCTRRGTPYSSTQWLKAATASAKATDKAAASVTGLGAAWQSTSNEAAKAQGELKTNISLLEKTQKASKASAENLVAEAKARGDHAGVLAAEAQAAEINAQAATALAIEHQKLAAAMAEELRQKQAMVANSPDEAEARDKEIKDLQAKVEATREVAAEKENLARAAELEAQAKALAIQADKDNSQSLQDYATALTIAKGAVAALELEHQAGNATAEEVRKARDRLTATEVLYQDALKDSIRMQEAKAQAELADLNLAKAGLSVELERAKRDEKRARRMEDEEGLMRALIKQKEIQIKIAKLEVQAEEAKANAAIASAKARMAQLEAEGKLTQAERIAIESAIKLAEAQKEVTKARRESIGAMEDELASIRTGGKAYEQLAGSIKNAANALRNFKAEGQKGGENKNSLIGRGNRFVVARGGRITDTDDIKNKGQESGGNTAERGKSSRSQDDEPRSIHGLRHAKSRGRPEPQRADLSFHFDAIEARNKGRLHELSDEQLQGFIRMARQHKQAEAAAPDAFSFDGKMARRQEDAAARDMERELMRRRYAEQAKANAKTNEEIVAQQLQAAQPQQQQPAQSRTYQINLDGYGSINTDRDGADAVEAFMKALERGKAATGRRL